VTLELIDVFKIYRALFTTGIDRACFKNRYSYS